MMHHHRKGEAAAEDPLPLPAEESGGVKMKELRGRLADYTCQHRKHGHDALLRMLASFALVSCLLLLLPGSPVSATMDELLQLGRRARHDDEGPAPPCADVANNTLCYDRTTLRTDVCVMRGDVRTQAASC